MELAPAADRELLASTAEAIENGCLAMAQQIADQQLENPFWLSRYGEGIKARLLQDQERNLHQLAGALWLDIPAEVRSHYRWLQSVLVARGATSAHIHEGLQAMIGVLAAHLAPPQAALAAAWIRGAMEGLVYDHPFARAAADGEAAIVGSALRELPDDSPGPAEYHRLRYLLSYLADALCRHEPTIFRKYICWGAGAREIAAADLHALATALASHVPGYAGEVAELIAVGQAALVKCA